ncbi:Zinc/iron permease [Rhizophagus irregularis]|uniref:Zinc/iron permease n=1 Tax=Rhizophagus irregularis TaxID=588596 RepID=A0A2I1GMP3_9GLOM|nr:Zinc/iron permease [Rhizophagus irregularis]
MKMNDCSTTPLDNNLQGWVLAFASGLACCLGASVVFSDLFFQKFFCTKYFQIVNNPKFLVASLSLGAGVMLYSSFFTMLTEAKESFSRAPKSKNYEGIYLMTFYFLGVIGSAVINRLIHYFLFKESSHHHHHLHNIDHNTMNDCPHNERSPLLKNNVNHMNGIPYCIEDGCSVCIVESDTEEPVVESLFCPDSSHDVHHSHPPHSSNDQSNQLMRIGIQTALAISIHKFPEGLITFVTSQVSPTIGLALFVAIAMHNISEGFTIALPLYIATRSRIKSFLYASMLGGLSQPLGALIGYLFLKESELACWDHNFIYGMLFAAVGGLMSVICIQGMLPQAIKNDKSDGTVVSIFFFMGVLIMSLSTALLEQAGLEP